MLKLSRNSKYIASKHRTLAKSEWVSEWESEPLLALTELETTNSAFADNEDQDQMAQNVLSDL